MYTNSVPMTMMDAEKSTRYTSRLLMIGASFLLGGLRMTCGSTGSTPSDWLGGPVHTVRKPISTRPSGWMRIWARTIHEDVDEKDLHSVQGVAQTEKGTQRDQRQCCNRGTELEREKVLDVVEY